MCTNVIRGDVFKASIRGLEVWERLGRAPHGHSEVHRRLGTIGDQLGGPRRRQLLGEVTDVVTLEVIVAESVQLFPPTLDRLGGFLQNHIYAIFGGARTSMPLVFAHEALGFVQFI